MPLNSKVASKLKSLADRGDETAKALVESALDCKLTAAAEDSDADTIKVTGQILDGVGNNVRGVKGVLITSVPVAGAGTLTDGGAGTVVAGSGTKQCWMETDSSGKFEVTVTNANAERNMVMVQMDNGDVAQISLTFA